MQFDIRRFDIYRKVPKDLTQPTSTGACISVISILFIIFLFYSELVSFLTIDVESEMFVEDPMTHSEKIPVKLDMELHKMPCKYIGLDIQDDLGRHEVGFVDNTEKTPINNGLGCRFKSHFKINKVPGNFHVSTHASQEQPVNPDMTHTVHEVIFGDRVPPKSSLPGSFNPLKGADKSKSNALSSHDYFLKVVPTVFEDIEGRQLIHPYQYTYAYRDYVQFGHGHKVTPAIWFRYDLSPITVKYKEISKPWYHFLTTNFDKFDQRGRPGKPAVWFRVTLQPITVKYTEKHKPLYHFLTNVCAIVGGSFTVAGILDSLLFTAAEIFKKAELGKLS